jgi:hypothetical protein
MIVLMFIESNLVERAAIFRHGGRRRTALFEHKVGLSQLQDMISNFTYHIHEKAIQ